MSSIFTHITFLSATVFFLISGSLQASILKVQSDYLTSVDPTKFTFNAALYNYQLSCTSTSVYAIIYPQAASGSSTLRVRNLKTGTDVNTTYSGSIRALTTDSTGQIAYLTTGATNNFKHYSYSTTHDFDPSTTVYQIYDSSDGFGLIWNVDDGTTVSLYTNIYKKADGTKLWATDLLLASFTHNSQLSIQGADAVYYSTNTSLIFAWDVVVNDPTEASNYEGVLGIYVAAVSVADWSAPGTVTSWLAVTPDTTSSVLTLRRVKLTTNSFAVIGLSTAVEAWLGVTSTKLTGIMSGVSDTVTFTYTRFTFDGLPAAKYITEFGVGTTIVSVFGWNYNADNTLYYAASVDESGAAVVEDQLLGENIGVWGACGTETSVYALVSGNDLVTGDPFAYLAQLW